MRTLLALIAILLAIPTYAAPSAEPITWTHDGKEFSGHLVYDKDSHARRPGLVMVPNWFGVTDSAVEKAKEIAGDDYVVLVADMFGAGVRPKDPDEALAAVRAVYADPEAMRGRVNAALATLRAQAGKTPLDGSRLGAVGFCFGGSSVLELARSGADIAGVVSLHGGLDTAKPAQAGEIKARLLVLNGADDTAVKPESKVAFEDEMRATGADWQLVDFGGARHCFAEADANRPPNCLYHERSARRAFRMMDGFFDEVFASE